MKKRIIFLIMLISIILTGCFKDDEAQIQLIINKGSFTGQYVHVGAFSNGEVVAQISTVTDSKVKPIYVPSNEKITFVILGEDSDSITYYDEQVVEITGESNQSVILDIEEIGLYTGASSGTNFGISLNGSVLSWKDVPGASEYKLRYTGGPSPDAFYLGSDPFTENPYSFMDYYYELIIRFGFVGKETNYLMGSSI